MNIKLLREIKKTLKKEPRQFIMSPNCGTAACIAGWALAIHNKMTLSLYRNSKALVDFEQAAASVLDITLFQASLLFVVKYWPKKYKLKWCSTLGDAKKQAKIACERIDYFIKTRR